MVLAISVITVLAMPLLPCAGATVAYPVRASAFQQSSRAAGIDAMLRSVRPDTAYISGQPNMAWPAATPAAYDPELGTLVSPYVQWSGYSDPVELGPSGWNYLPNSNSSADQVYNGAIEYDAAMHTLLWFTYFRTYPSESGYLGQVWSYSNGSWTLLKLGSGPQPPVTGQPSFVYDPMLNGVVMFGGWNKSNEFPTYDTWLFRDSGWYNLTVNYTVHPSPRYGASFVYDPTNGEAYLIGGVGQRGILYQTWELSSSGWTNLTATIAVPPPLANGGAVVYDSAIGTLLSIGPGSTLPGLATMNLNNVTSETVPIGYTEEWELNGTSWINVTSSTGPLPFTGTGGMLSDDPALGGVVLAGGEYTYYYEGGPGCPEEYPAILEPVTVDAVPVMTTPTLSYTWSFSNSSWTTLSRGGFEPEYYPAYEPLECSYNDLPVLGMALVGGGMFVGIGGALGMMFYKDNMHNLGKPIKVPWIALMNVLFIIVLIVLAAWIITAW